MVGNSRLLLADNLKHKLLSADSRKHKLPSALSSKLNSEPYPPLLLKQHNRRAVVSSVSTTA